MAIVLNMNDYMIFGVRCFKDAPIPIQKVINIMVVKVLKFVMNGTIGKSLNNGLYPNGYQDTLTIDRIDTNGNYEPNNCRWVDTIVQANNKTTNKYIAFNNKTQSLAEWCRELNLDYDRTKQRINACNMTPKQAFTLPKYYTQKYNGNKRIK